MAAGDRSAMVAPCRSPSLLTVFGARSGCATTTTTTTTNAVYGGTARWQLWLGSRYFGIVLFGRVCVYASSGVLCVWSRAYRIIKIIFDIISHFGVRRTRIYLFCLRNAWRFFFSFSLFCYIFRNTDSVRSSWSFAYLYTVCVFTSSSSSRVCARESAEVNHSIIVYIVADPSWRLDCRRNRTVFVSRPTPPIRAFYRVRERPRTHGDYNAADSPPDATATGFRQRRDEMRLADVADRIRAGGRRLWRTASR